MKAVHSTVELVVLHMLSMLDKRDFLLRNAVFILLQSEFKVLFSVTQLLFIFLRQTDVRSLLTPAVAKAQHFFSAQLIDVQLLTSLSREAVQPPITPSSEVAQPLLSLSDDAPHHLFAALSEVVQPPFSPLKEVPQHPFSLSSEAVQLPTTPLSEVALLPLSLSYEEFHFLTYPCLSSQCC
jgi:hypothetical protein